jgi:hypothetical protein
VKAEMLVPCGRQVSLLLAVYLRVLLLLLLLLDQMLLLL